MRAWCMIPPHDGTGRGEDVLRRLWHGHQQRWRIDRTRMARRQFEQMHGRAGRRSPVAGMKVGTQ